MRDSAEKAVAQIMEVVHQRPTFSFLQTLPLHELWAREHLIIHALQRHLGSQFERLHDSHERLHDSWFSSNECADKRNCAFKEPARCKHGETEPHAIYTHNQNGQQLHPDGMCEGPERPLECEHHCHEYGAPYCTGCEENHPDVFPPCQTCGEPMSEADLRPGAAESARLCNRNRCHVKKS
jgi:hypothetical protein